MIMPVGMSMLMHAFPPAERIRAAKILTVPTAFAPALGPVIGGLLVTNYSWEWVFFLNVPIGIVRDRVRRAVRARDARADRRSLRPPRLPARRRRPRRRHVRAERGRVEGLGQPAHRRHRRRRRAAARACSSSSSCARAEPMLDLPLFANGLFRNCNLVIMTAVRRVPRRDVPAAACMLQEADGLHGARERARDVPDRARRHGRLAGRDQATTRSSGRAWCSSLGLRDRHRLAAVADAGRRRHRTSGSIRGDRVRARPRHGAHLHPEPDRRVRDRSRRRATVARRRCSTCSVRSARPSASPC